MKNYLAIGTFTLLCLSFIQISLAQDVVKKNLLFIITDQQRYDALAYAGNTVIKTPNLDRLAQEGAYFRNAYSPCAVCGPARASILTGSTVESTGVFSNDQTYYYEGDDIMKMPTFDQVLSENGYHCEYYGKWHSMTSSANVYENPVLYSANGNPIFGPGGQSHIWRDYLNTLGQVPAPGTGEFVDGMSKYPYIVNPLDRYYGKSWEELISSNLSHTQPDQHGELQLDKEHTMTAFQAKQTLEAIERLKDSTFSITCSFHFPHSPMLAPEPFYGMYPVEDMIPPYSINDDMKNSPYANANGRKNRTEYADPDKIKYMISEYYGLISEIDDWIGKILDKIDELGLADNTMIIFTSDHGEMLGAHGMREKNVFYEESSHIPLLIKVPGEVQAETTIDGYISLIDLFPTILDYLEVPERESEGKSLRGLLEKTDTEHGKYVVTEWDRDNISNYMVVKDGWKLIIPYTIKSTVINAMYDLNTDPHEINNLLGNNPDRAQYQEQAEELRACLLEFLEERNSVHYYSVSQRDLLEGGKATGNNSAFVSQQVPELKEGETLNVSITMKNTGTTAWTQTGQFKLGSMSPADNDIWGLKRIDLNIGDSIVPGAEKTFTFDISVPDIDGIFNFHWQMVQDGEEWFGEKSEIKQVITGNPGGFWDDCDAKTDWKSSAGLSLNTSDNQQGNACIEFSAGSVDEFKKTFSTPYNSFGSVSNTELRLWYYVSDVTQFEASNQLEIGSAGKPDTDEFNWNLNELTNGWNYLVLKTSQAGKIGSPNLNAINWFRIYHKKTGEITSRIDAIQLIDPTVGPLYTLLVDGGNGGGNYPGQYSVSITAKAAPSGMKFDKWIIESGNPTIADVNAANTTLSLGEGSAFISSSYKDIPAKVESSSYNHNIKLYPNPAKDYYSVELNLEESAEIAIKLMDLSGRAVGKTITNQLKSGNEVITIPSSGLQSGMYMLNIKIDDKPYSKPLFIK
ncbi:MAG: sulfatase-like hydrolase/transferase [Bacteroidales bacterium]|jgi:arylsulfatase A-like enzyme|nr:sulfatase-like hydrolase/transferase [Bacteroidales bacterium]